MRNNRRYYRSYASRFDLSISLKRAMVIIIPILLLLFYTITMLVFYKLYLIEQIEEENKIIEEYVKDLEENDIIYEEPEWLPLNEEDVNAIARTLYGECRGIPSTTEKAAVAWCILNRVDSPKFPNTIIEVVSAPNQFVGYNPNHPVTDELYALSEDVLIRWYQEKDGIDSGRVLPSDYLFFTGDGQRNNFRQNYNSSNRWDWSITGIYED